MKSLSILIVTAVLCEVSFARVRRSSSYGWSSSSYDDFGRNEKVEEERYRTWPRKSLYGDDFDLGDSGSWWNPFRAPRRPIRYTTTPRPNLAAVMASCIKECPVSYDEYSPVCGSNNVTYQNLGRLECEQKCGKPVTLRSSTACSGPVKGGPINRQALVACIRKCSYEGEFKPVCGNNNVTYMNLDRLLCEKNCGIDVELSKQTECEPEEVTTEKILTKEEKIANCIKTCSVTGEHNPVCGSNNVTYENRERLDCEKNCGVDVQLSRPTSCLSPIVGNDQLTTTSTARSYVNGDVNNSAEINKDHTNNNHGNNNVSKSKNENSDFSACQRLCHLTNENNLVCGNDGITYTNPGRLVCAQFCGKDVKAAKFGSCSAPPAKLQPESSTIVTNTVVTDRSTTPPNRKQICLESCPDLHAYKPVCNGNNVIYKNREMLLCARNCGVDVKVEEFAPCSSQSTTTTIRPSSPKPEQSTKAITPVVVNKPATTPSPVKNCMEACPDSPDYKPVCGSDHVTYRNKELLQCARNCGVAVSVVSDSECSLTTSTAVPPAQHSTSQSNEECIKKRCAVVGSTFAPICGSNGVTYTNTAHLICARMCGTDVRVQKLSPC